VWYTLTTLPSTVWFVAVLVLLFRLFRRANRDGIYTIATVRGLQILGWLVIAGAIVTKYAEQAAKARLLAAMVSDHIGGYFIAAAPAYAPMVLVGVGVLTFSRIVRAGCRMRQDLDATI